MPSSSPPSRPPAPRRALLERIARPLLLRLLAPHEVALARAGFPLATLVAASAKDRAPLRALHDLLDDTADAALFPLLHTLAAVSRVATAAGRESLIALDTGRVLPARLGAEDLAATAALDQPALFTAVRVAPSADAIRNFVHFLAAPDREPCFDPTRIDAVKGALAAWFEAHHRTAYCDVHLRRRGDELHFEITHGKTPTTHDLLDDALSPTIVTQISTARSYAIYDEAKRLLAIHAFEFLKEPLRAAFSLGLAGDATYFGRADGLVAATAFRDLDAALAPDPELGVYGVELRELEVVAPDGSSAFFASPRADLRATVQRRRVLAALDEEGACVAHAKIALTLACASRPFLVVLKPLRHQLDYDRRARDAERVLLGWLAARSIWNEPRRASTAPGDAAVA